ncbi:hypothetical protein BUALT_Bualt06G0099500 [Buddleja alternifolia]|uniref:Membrane-associated kinase regulator 5 n=1 Tax=Buddleja alternifolia TaxID=168488 RepID=A0AAV6XPW7_9LAMI|nr:hypothetical protein BUALT_Bualt06G0099500 [Buddleja alternifolia]
MEALGILKFWRNAAPGTDASSHADDVRSAAAFVTDDEETDDEDSLFDLAIKSPDRKANDEATKKQFQFIESPRDVFMSKNDFSTSSPITTLRSSPKFKVFTLGFRKSSKTESSNAAELKASPSNHLSKSSKLGHSNRFSVAPVFARDNSLRSKMLKESCEYDVVVSQKSVPKYLKLIRPLYVKATKKAKLTDSVTPSASPVTVPVNFSPRKISEGSRVGSFKIVTRNLVKSRSASAAADVAPPSIRRRDDSLLQQRDDGIQGAILHCKKSYASQASSLPSIRVLLFIVTSSSQRRLLLPCSFRCHSQGDEIGITREVGSTLQTSERPLDKYPETTNFYAGTPLFEPDISSPDSPGEESQISGSDVPPSLEILPLSSPEILPLPLSSTLLCAHMVKLLLQSRTASFSSLIGPNL